MHNIAAIASGIARSGADIIAIDGFRGGTGAAPTRIRDNVGIPIELALAAVDQRLREEGIRDQVSLIAGGSIRSSADVVKAVALGADAVLHRHRGAAGAGLPSVPHLPDGHGATGASPRSVRSWSSGWTPTSGAQRLVNLDHGMEARDQGDDGRHGHQLHRERCGATALMLRGVGLNGEGAGNSRRGATPGE